MESTETRPKNRGKKWLFPCFKPGDMNDSIRTRSRKVKTDPLLTYIAVAEKDGVVLPTILSSALTAAKGGEEGSGTRRRKKVNDGSLRQALKAVLNETSLGKKIITRRKTNKDNLYRSSSSNLGECDKISNSERKITHRTNSNTSSYFHCSPAFTPSSLSSSTSSSNSSRTQASGSSTEIYPPRVLPINGIEVTKQKQDDVVHSRKSYFGSKTAVCLLLIILLVLILWGKFCAIICTSIGFFVVPPLRRRPCNEEAVHGETEFESVQYKRRRSLWKGCLRGAVAIAVCL